jgi:uncharacterized protein YbjT (DUF2867 family)
MNIKLNMQPMTAAIFGSTGLVGQQIVEQLSGRQEFNGFVAFGRRRPDWLPANVEFKNFSPSDVQLNGETTHAFCALGTTMKKAGSKKAFLDVDLHSVVSAAEAAKSAGAKCFAVVSSIGANPKSGNFYLRTKGEMEEALKALNFEKLIIARPSLLLGNRTEKRFGERVGIILYKVFRFMFVGSLRKYKGIEASDVARAMIKLALNDQKGVIVVESDKLKEIAKD